MKNLKRSTHPGLEILRLEVGEMENFVYINACGRCDFRGSDPEAMYHSLTSVLGQLPDQTVLYPGHNYAAVPDSTMGAEKQNNPYYQAPMHAAAPANGGGGEPPGVPGGPAEPRAARGRAVR